MKTLDEQHELMKQWSEMFDWDGPAMAVAVDSNDEATIFSLMVPGNPTDYLPKLFGQHLETHELTLVTFISEAYYKEGKTIEEAREDPGREVRHVISFDSKSQRSSQYYRDDLTWKETPAQIDPRSRIGALIQMIQPLMKEAETQ